MTIRMEREITNTLQIIVFFSAAAAHDTKNSRMDLTHKNLQDSSCSSYFFPTLYCEMIDIVK